jgi:hypothetical protein
MWIWFTAADDGAPPKALMYARHHYKGRVQIGDRIIDVTVFEVDDHDALYRDDGICFDLDANGTCDEEREVVYDGGTLRVDGLTIRVRLAYP